MKVLLLLAAVAWSGPAPRNAAVSLTSLIEEGLQAVGWLDEMVSTKTYTVKVGKQRVTARPASLQRRRDADDVKLSGWSASPADDALVFYDFALDKGLEARFIDSVELTATGFWTRAHDHTAVAIREVGGKEWALVDPHGRKVLARPWKGEPIYGVGLSRFWIAYDGPWAKHPARSPKQLQEFIEKAWTRIPREVVERELVRPIFAVDPSLRSGALYSTRRLGSFLELWDEVYEKMKAGPARRPVVTLVAGGEGEKLDCAPEGAGWKCKVEEDCPLDAETMRRLELQLDAATRPGAKTRSAQPSGTPSL